MVGVVGGRVLGEMLLLLVLLFVDDALVVDSPDVGFVELGIVRGEVQLVSGVGDEEAVSCSQAVGPVRTDVLSFGGLMSFMLGCEREREQERERGGGVDTVILKDEFD